MIAATIAATIIAGPALIRSITTIISSLICRHYRQPPGLYISSKGSSPSSHLGRFIALPRASHRLTVHTLALATRPAARRYRRLAEVLPVVLEAVGVPTAEVISFKEIFYPPPAYT